MGGPFPEEEEADKDRLRDVVRKIKDGTFAKIWTDVQENGAGALDREKVALDAMPLMMEERRL